MQPIKAVISYGIKDYVLFRHDKQYIYYHVEQLRVALLMGYPRDLNASKFSYSLMMNRQAVRKWQPKTPKFPYALINLFGHEADSIIVH